NLMIIKSSFIYLFFFNSSYCFFCIRSQSQLFLFCDYIIKISCT
ncbi:hypothetical protein M153_8120002, partial [Pseudoloma neurophilia]